MDKTHAYNRILKCGLVAALGGNLFMLASIQPHHRGQLVR